MPNYFPVKITACDSMCRKVSALTMQVIKDLGP
jgi:hypothetical protein